MNELKQKLASLEKEIDQIKKQRQSGKLANKGKALMDAFNALDKFTVEKTPSKKLLQSVESSVSTGSPETEKCDSESESDTSIGSFGATLNGPSLTRNVPSTDAANANIKCISADPIAEVRRPAISFTAADLQVDMMCFYCILFRIGEFGHSMSYDIKELFQLSFQLHRVAESTSKKKDYRFRKCQQEEGSASTSRT
jgi:hypothetical protein